MYSQQFSDKAIEMKLRSQFLRDVSNQLTVVHHWSASLNIILKFSYDD